MENTVIPGVRRIAVLRAGGLGDFVFATPALQSLREAYPDAEITLLTGPLHRELIEGRPGPWDRVEVVPRYPGVREDDLEPCEPLASFLDRMRSRRFDLAVQMHGGGRNSNPLIRDLRAAVTVGCRTPDAMPLDRELPHVFLHSEATRWLELIALIGGRFRATVPHLEVTDVDRARAGEVLPPDGRAEVTLHPGAGSPRRRWPVERFARLGDGLARMGMRVVLVGGPADAGLTHAVADAMTETHEDLGGRLSLRALIGLFARASLHVGNDSGPAHIARAVAPATLTLTWGPNLLTAGPIGPAHRHRAVLGWQMECPECATRLVEDSCSHSSSLIDGIDVGDVLDQARELIGAAP